MILRKIPVNDLICQFRERGTQLGALRLQARTVMAVPEESELEWNQVV